MHCSTNPRSPAARKCNLQALLHKPPLYRLYRLRALPDAFDGERHQLAQCTSGWGISGELFQPVVGGVSVCVDLLECALSAGGLRQEIQGARDVIVVGQWAGEQPAQLFPSGGVFS